MTGLLARLVAAAPAPTPGPDEARDWAERELADPAYAAAHPTWFDRLARAVADFFGHLFDSTGGGQWGPVLAIVVGVVAAVALVAAILVWGLPRMTRRAEATTAPMVLFGEEEARSAAELRRDAAAHAERGQWDSATILRFRALARGLLEREAVQPPPGATVHAFARAASRAFPASAADLESAASAFDDVRYLRRPGTPELYRSIAAADDAVAASQPAPTPTGVLR